MFRGGGIKTIAMVSTYPPQVCGIGKYTYDLVTHLEKNHSKDYKIKIVQIEPKRHEKEDYVRLKEKIGNCDLVHIQDTLTWYGNRTAYVNFLKEYKGKAIITLHEVGTEQYDWYGDVWRYVQFIVGNDKMYNAVNPLLGGNGMIDVIPLGATISKPIDTKIAREKLGFKVDEKVIVCPGFYGADKGMDEMVEALSILKRDGMNVKLVFAGGIHPNAPQIHWDYLKQVAIRVKELNLFRDITITNRYLSEDEMDLYCSAGDIIAINHKFIFGCLSASALAKRVLSFGKPLIMSNDVRLSEYEDGKNCLRVEGVGDIIKGIKELTLNKGMYDKLGEGAKIYANKTSWDRVAWTHARLYGFLYYLRW